MSTGAKVGLSVFGVLLLLVTVLGLTGVIPQVSAGPTALAPVTDGAEPGPGPGFGELPGDPDDPPGLGPDPDFGNDGAGGVVRFEVFSDSGSGSATVLYSGDLGSENEEVTLPWNKEVQVDDPTLTVLTATSSDNVGIGCRITVNGQVVAEEQPSGGVPFNSCFGS